MKSKHEVVESFVESYIRINGRKSPRADVIKFCFGEGWNIGYDEGCLSYRNENEELRHMCLTYQLRAEKFKDALDRIAMIGMGPMAYTSEFTNKVNGIARAALQEDK